MSFSGNYSGKFQLQIAIVPLDSNSPRRTRRRQQKGRVEAIRQDGKEDQVGIVQPIEMAERNPIRAHTFQSRAYEYYDPAISTIAHPVQLEITAGK